MLSRGRPIDLEHLPAELSGMPADVDLATVTRPLAQAVREFEREYLTRALHLAGGVRVRAAQLLGISRKTLWMKLRELGVANGDNGSEVIEDGDAPEDV